MKLYKKISLKLFLIGVVLAVNTMTAHAADLTQITGAQNQASFCTHDTSWRSEEDSADVQRILAFCNSANAQELANFDLCHSGDNRDLDRNKYFVGPGRSGRDYLVEFCNVAVSINPQTGVNTSGGSDPLAHERSPEEQAENLQHAVEQGEGANTVLDGIIREFRSRAGCYQSTVAIPVAAICNYSIAQTVEICRSDERLSQPQFQSVNALRMCNQIRAAYGQSVFTAQSNNNGSNDSNNAQSGPSDEDQCEADGGVWNAEDGLCLPYQPQTNDCQGVTVEESNCGIIRWLVILINVLSGMAGIVIVGAIVVGGMQYSSAGSDPQKVSAAKNRIRNAVIALLFFLFGYGILNFLIPGGLL